MKSGKYLVWMTLIIVSLLLGACGQQAAPAAVEEAPVEAAEEGGQGSLAVILTGPWDDNSWNEAGYDAVQALGEDGVKIAFSENVADADVGRVLREYVDQGFEMIVAHSFSYQDPTFEVGEEAPDTNFAWAGGIGRTAKNVAEAWGVSAQMVYTYYIGLRREFPDLPELKVRQRRQAAREADARTASMSREPERDDYYGLMACQVTDTPDGRRIWLLR